MLERKIYAELSPDTHFALDLDSSVMPFDDPARQRETQPGSVAFRRVEGSENVRKIFGRDAPAGIGDGHHRFLVQSRQRYPDRAGSINGLDRIEQQIQ